MALRLFFVGLGGFLGAIFRYLISSLTQNLTSFSFPVGTLLVNVAGSLLLAFLTIFAFEQGTLPVYFRLFFLTGLLGAFTTYSTFSYETLELMRRNLHRLYLLNIASNTILSIVGAWVGFALGDLFKG